MNAAEHIVECYFRITKKCFTLDDVKVIGGNNRQIDLLAINLRTKEQFHIETHVTHQTMWALDAKGISQFFEYKFLGFPRKREGKKTDYSRGVNYRRQIEDTYKSVGLDPEKIQRVFVCWIIKDQETYDLALAELQKRHSCTMAVVSFRDIILPALQDAVGTTNYDDEVLRTFSLIKEREKQARKN
jgi:hypothetical protein